MFGEWLLCRIMSACSFATLADIILNFWRSLTKLSNDQGDFQVPGIAENVFFLDYLCASLCMYIYIMLIYILYVYVYIFIHILSYRIYTHICNIYSHPWWSTSHVFIATHDETRAMFFFNVFLSSDTPSWSAMVRIQEGCTAWDSAPPAN